LAQVGMERIHRLHIAIRVMKSSQQAMLLSSSRRYWTELVVAKGEVVGPLPKNDQYQAWICTEFIYPKLSEPYRANPVSCLYSDEGL